MIFCGSKNPYRYRTTCFCQILVDIVVFAHGLRFSCNIRTVNPNLTLVSVKSCLALDRKLIIGNDSLWFKILTSNPSWTSSFCLILAYPNCIRLCVLAHDFLFSCSFSLFHLYLSRWASWLEIWGTNYQLLTVSIVNDVLKVPMVYCYLV